MLQFALHHRCAAAFAAVCAAFAAFAAAFGVCFCCCFSLLFSAVLAIHFSFLCLWPTKKQAPAGTPHQKKNSESTSWEIDVAGRGICSVSSVSSPSTSRTNISVVSNQNSGAELAVLDSGAVRTACEDCCAQFGVDQPPGEELTVQQLSALKDVLDRDVAPYMDSALWRPHGNSCVNSGCLARSSTARVSW